MRSILIRLVLACLLPGAIGSAAMLYISYQSERSQVERDTIQTARAMMQTVDAELRQGEVAALALATSGHLAAKDFSAFHAQAEALLRQTGVGNNFVVSDADGQQLVNTLRPFPSVLPRHSNPDQLRRVFAKGKPVLSDIYIGSVLGRPLMSIDVPIWRDGRVVYDLSMGIFPEHLERILSAQHLPPDWVVSIFDSQGVIAARTRAADSFVGKKGAPALLQRLEQSNEGMVETETLEGIPVTAVFSRSPSSKWSVAIGIPTKALTAELRHRFLLLLIAVTALIAAGVLLASLLAKRIAQSIRALIVPAMALGSGKPVAIPRVHLREAGDVGAAIAKAADLLALRTLAANVYHNISDGIVVTDPEANIVSVNPAFCALTGYAAEELVGTNPRIIKSNRHDPDFYRGVWETITKSSTWQGEIWNRRKDGSIFLAHETISAIRDDHGRILNYIGVMSDITEAKQLEEFIRRQAYYDPLTKLPNRALFMDRLHQDIPLAHRHKSDLALLFIDLDHFKEINDELGHDVGDELLRAAAARLAGCIRESDTVARLGGDEFTAILNDVSGREDAAEVARKMLGEMGRPFQIGQHELRISASIGIALYPDDGDNAADLLKTADEAMYGAKRSGRNAFSFAAVG